MSKAFAILAGLKRVDPKAYEGWDGVNGCWGCELDVDNLDRILKPLGYSIKIFKTAAATRRKVLDSLRDAAGRLRKGDTLAFYYSGHGGQQPDVNGDEPDGQDETLCAYDGEIIDDQLNEIWPKFRAGVRIVMISDSCNSGTNYRMIRSVRAADATPIRPVDEAISGKMKAQMIHFGGCRDGASSEGYEGGGAFTTALCNVWKKGAFAGNYKHLLEAARDKLSGQVAQYNEYGPVTDAFRNEKPFSTDSPAGPADAADRDDAPESCIAFARPATGRLIGRRFAGERGPDDTPAANGTVAKSSYVQQVAQQSLAGKFSADPGVRLGDAMYYLPTYQELEHLLAASQLDRRQWLAERFDCDDFAYVLKAEASVNAYDAGDLTFGFCVGMVWGNFDWVDGYHAVNWFIDATGKLYLIEPQSDSIYDASHCRDAISLLLV